ncbi:MAG: hypothetical protein IE933_14115 [Sphingomonadales bacterium]|nr:hypothetical protein [Sphingomonadales bacterium]MBD3775097.1 hypothetical protein [Paracoccaceae bacterium]
MSKREEIDLDRIEIADSWGRNVTDDLERSARRAWSVAAVAALVAVLEGIALVALTPLKTVEPYTLLVDRQTGNVERLAPLDAQVVAPDTALTRSFLVQYVIAREGFYADNLQDDYRKVSLWSAPRVRQAYKGQMQATNPLSPLAYLPRGAVQRVEVRSVSSLGANRSLVRFDTIRQDLGAQPQTAQHWVAVIDFAFTSAAMSEADRLVNPLGFQVTRYRRDAEALPETPAPVVDEALPPTRRSAQQLQGSQE